MASKLITCSTSPLISNKPSSNPSRVTLGPQCVEFRGSKSSKMTRSSSLVVRAQMEEGGLSKEISHNIDPVLHMHLQKRVAMVDTSPYMRTPWNTAEDETEVRMWFDMPGLTAEGIDVDVVDHLLTIRGTEGIDAFGRKIHSPFDCKLQLPVNCAKEETQAVLKNGVLYISVPKITKAEHMKLVHVPVRAIV